MCMCVCVYVCMCVCVYVCVFVCMYLTLWIHILYNPYVHVCVHASIPTLRTSLLCIILTRPRSVSNATAAKIYDFMMLTYFSLVCGILLRLGFMMFTYDGAREGK